MSTDPITIYDGMVDTTVRMRVGDDNRLDVDLGDRGLGEAAKAATSAILHGTETDPVTLRPVARDPRQPLLRVLSGAPSRRQLLALRVAGGRLVADYDPADVTEAALLFVDALIRQWAAEMDANRRFAQDIVEGVLRDAARQQTIHGDTISVELAARTVTDLMWPRP